MDESKLDVLLNKLKESDGPIEFVKFCKSTWDKPPIKFKTCLEMSEELVRAGHAVYLPNNQTFLSITESGKNFIGYVQTSLNEIIRKDNMDELSKLTRDNLLLQNESLTYQHKIREQQEKIATLTEKNLFLQNRQLRRYIIYSITSAISGAILSNLKEVCQYLQTHIQ